MADPIIPPVVPAAAASSTPATTAAAPSAASGSDDSADIAARAIDSGSGDASQEAQDTGQALNPDTGFDTALDQATNVIGTRLQKEADTYEANEGVMNKALDVGTSAGMGVVRAAVNTANTIGDILHLPPGKGIMATPVINSLYAAGADMDRKSMANSLTDNVVNFATGLLGIGKVMDGLKITAALSSVPKVGQLVTEVTKGAATAATVFAPHQARLSDLVQSLPAIRNPINAFLASTGNDDDSNTVGRLKNALEGAGMDVALATTFSAAMGAYRAAAARAAGVAGSDTALASATKDLSATVKGRAPGTGHMGDDQVAPTDPLAADSAGDTGGYQTPPPATDSTAPQATQGGTDVAASDGPATATVHGATPEVEAPAEPPPATTPANRGAAVGSVEPVRIDGTPPGGIQLSRPAAAPSVADPAEVVATMVSHARDAGDFKGKLTGDALGAAKAAVPVDAPRIETNGIGYTVIPHASMQATAKAAGIAEGDTALAYAGKNGVVISDKLLTLSPAKQATVLAHETGHVLEPQFRAAIKGSGATLDNAELTAASKALRPEAYDAAKSNAGTAKGATQATYLSKPAEKFADAFALWKTNPSKMAEVAPATKALFDEHFAPWIDTDMSVIAPNTKAAVKQGVVGQRVPISGPRPSETRPQVAAKSPPGVRMVPQVTDTEQLMKSSQQDQAAIKQFGSVAEAQAAGYKFANSTLPWQKLLAGGEEGYTQLQNRLAQDFKGTLDTMKGGDVLHDARVEAMVQERVKLFNEDPSQIIGELQAAGHNANGFIANMEAAFAIANKAQMDLSKLTNDISMGNFAEFGGDGNAAKAALPGRLAVYVEAIGNAQAMRATLGRGLRRMRGEFQITPDTLNKIRTLDPDHAASLIQQAGGNPVMMAKMANGTWWNNALRVAGTYLQDNLLWNWKTHVAIDLSHAFMLSTSPAARAVGSVFMGSAGNDVRTIALREYRYMLTNMADAARVAKDAYLRGDGVLNPHSAEAWENLQAGMGATPQQPAGAAKTLAASAGMVPVQTFGDVISNGIHGLGFLLGQPMRVHGFENEIIQQISYRASIMAKASLDADKLGLGGDDYHDFLQKAVDNSMDANGNALDKAAAYDSQVRTFSQPLLKGTAGAATVKFAKDLGGWTRFILPFQQTPINLFRMSIKLTPGLNLLQGEYRAMIHGDLGAARQADAYGQMVLGTGILATGWALAHGGAMTGGAPPNPADAKALEATGWRPYSVVLAHPDGTHTFVPYDRFDPVGMILGMIADTGQIAASGQLNGDGLGQLVLPMTMALMKNLTDRTYLENLSNALNAITNPQEGLPKFAGNTLQSMIPASSLLAESNPDPYTRDARTVLDIAMSKLPGFSPSLPPTRDAFGAPIMRTNTMAYTDSANNVVDAEQQRMEQEYGFGVTAPSSQPWGGVDLRQFNTNTGQTAFDRWQDLSQQPAGAPMSMKQSLAKEIMSPGYRDMADGDGSVKGTKLATLQSIVGKYRDAAKMQLLKENPTLAVQLGARQQAARQAYRNAQQGQQTSTDVTNKLIGSGLSGINKAFGLTPQ